MQLPEFHALLDSYLRGELHGSEKDAFDRAIAENPALRAELDAQRKMDGLMRDLPPAPPAPSSLKERIMERVRAEKSGAATAGVSQSAPLRRKISFGDYFRRTLTGWRFQTAVAICLVGAVTYAVLHQGDLSRNKSAVYRESSSPEELDQALSRLPAPAVGNGDIPGRPSRDARTVRTRFTPTAPSGGAGRMDALNKDSDRFVPSAGAPLEIVKEKQRVGSEDRKENETKTPETSLSETKKGTAGKAGLGVGGAAAGRSASENRPVERKALTLGDDLAVSEKSELRSGSYSIVAEIKPIATPVRTPTPPRPVESPVTDSLSGEAGKRKEGLSFAAAPAVAAADDIALAKAVPPAAPPPNLEGMAARPPIRNMPRTATMDSPVSSAAFVPERATSPMSERESKPANAEVAQATKTVAPRPVLLKIYLNSASLARPSGAARQDSSEASVASRQENNLFDSASKFYDYRAARLETTTVRPAEDSARAAKPTSPSLPKREEAPAAQPSQALEKEAVPVAGPKQSEAPTSKPEINGGKWALASGKTSPKAEGSRRGAVESISPPPTVALGIQSAEQADLAKARPAASPETANDRLPVPRENDWLALQAGQVVSFLTVKELESRLESRGIRVRRISERGEIGKAGRDQAEKALEESQKQPGPRADWFGSSHPQVVRFACTARNQTYDQVLRQLVDCGLSIMASPPKPELSQTENVAQPLDVLSHNPSLKGVIVAPRDSSTSENAEKVDSTKLRISADFEFQLEVYQYSTSPLPPQGN